MVTKVIAWQTGSGNITLTYQGQGDGTISIQSDANNGSVRSQVITVETVGGAITRNLTISQAACPSPVGDVKNFSYTGSYQEVELPAGQYKLQCWGAQGGSNDAAAAYSITAKAGGKGGYAEGIITLTQKTIVKVYVGGQGSSSAGGFNGGGSTTGSSTYNSGNEQGVSRMGGGGGATDMRLSDGTLLSRMIVAGGGAGGAMCYKKITTSGTSTIINSSLPLLNSGNVARGISTSPSTLGRGKTYTISWTSSGTAPYWVGFTYYESEQSGYIGSVECSNGRSITMRSSSDWGIVYILAYWYNATDAANSSCTVEITESTSSTTTSNESQVGGVGGGTQGGAYSSTYAGKQNAAGVDGSFGQGAHQYSKNNRYASGAGGGGWYGGGRGWSNSDMSACKKSGGGSGFVNTAASAGNRPSGYTGLQLDSGNTVDGEQTFEAPAGGTETGHSGNGYARITRLN